MKLKERLRIAWQLLTKGTCDELKRAEQEKEKAIKAAYDFEYFMRMADVEHPAVLTSGTVVYRINLIDTELGLIHPNERPYYSPAHPRKNYIYTLRNVERDFVWEVTAQIVEELDYFKMKAAQQLAHVLIDKGLVKMEVLSSPDEYNVKRVRYWVPYYRLEK